MTKKIDVELEVKELPKVTKSVAQEIDNTDKPITEVLSEAEDDESAKNDNEGSQESGS